MTANERLTVADPRPSPREPLKMCDHICLLDDGHVERGELHFHGYELPSPRRQMEPTPTCDAHAVGLLDVLLVCSLPLDHRGQHRTAEGADFLLLDRDLSAPSAPKSKRGSYNRRRALLRRRDRG